MLLEKSAPLLDGHELPFWDKFHLPQPQVPDHLLHAEINGPLWFGKQSTLWNPGRHAFFVDEPAQLFAAGG